MPEWHMLDAMGVYFCPLLSEEPTGRHAVLCCGLELHAREQKKTSDFFFPEFPLHYSLGDARCFCVPERRPVLSATCAISRFLTSTVVLADEAAM